MQRNQRPGTIAQAVLPIQDQILLPLDFFVLQCRTSGGAVSFTSASSICPRMVGDRGQSEHMVDGDEVKVGDGCRRMMKCQVNVYESENEWIRLK